MPLHKKKVHENDEVITASPDPMSLAEALKMAETLPSSKKLLLGEYPVDEPSRVIHEAATSIWTAIINYRHALEKNIKQNDDIKLLLKFAITLIDTLKKYPNNQSTQHINIKRECALIVNAAISAYTKKRMNAHSTCLYILKKLHTLQLENQTPLSAPSPTRKSGNTMFSKKNEEQESLISTIQYITSVFTLKMKKH